MTRTRAAFSLALKVTAGSSVSNHCQQQQQTKQPNFHNSSFVTPVNCAAEIGKRFYSTQNITKNLKLITHDLTPKVDKLTLQMEPTSGLKERPLAVVLEWMLAKHKHIQKFASLYLNGGYDVLLAPLNPVQLLFPTSGSQLIADELIKFLESNQKYQELILHGFSVGGYLWGEVCQKLLTNYPEMKLSDMMQKFKGQIWDSAVDVAGVEKGVAAAVFPSGSILRGLLEKSLKMHLNLFYESSTKHYLASSERFHDNLLPVPAMFFVSKADPVGTVEQNMKVKEAWTNKGIETFMKCWDTSPHVGHLQKHREEYIVELNKFLLHINMPLVLDDKTKSPLGAKL